MGITPYRLAKDIGVPVNRITAIIKEERRISAETALLLSRYFGVSDSLWSNLQAHYNLECAKDALEGKLKTIPTCQHLPLTSRLVDQIAQNFYLCRCANLIPIFPR